MQWLRKHWPTTRTILICTVVCIIFGLAIYYIFFSHPCHNVACAKKHDAWFMARYDPNVPLFLNSENAADILDNIKGAGQRKVAGEMLDDLSGLADKTLAGFAGKGFATCAVVGNSGNLLGSNYGPLIDGHTYVFRINDAPLWGYEKDVGTRTTFHFLDSSHRRIAIYTPHTITIVMISQWNFNLLQPESRQKYNEENAYAFEWLTTQIMPKEFPPFDFRTSSKIIFPTNILDLPGGLYFLSTDFQEYVNHTWFLPNNRHPFEYPSTGFTAIILALNLCDQIDIFGFGPDTKGRWGHYYYGGSLWQGHRIDYQEHFLNELEHYGIIHIYRGT